MSCVMFATQAAFQISPIARNAQQLIQKIVLTIDGSATSATGIYLDGGNGNAYFAGKVGIGTGASNIYTINTNGGLRVGDGESSSRYGAIYSDNGFYKTYIWKYTDENNAWSINYGILINWSGNFGSMMWLRVIMQNVTRRAATFIGRVGIGTDTPVYDLDVVGTGRFSSGLIVNGNVGIGTDTPKAKLDIRVGNDGSYLSFTPSVGATGFMFFNNSTGEQLSLYPATWNAFGRPVIAFWSKDRNVAIGNWVNSNYALDVSGAGHFSSGLKVDGNLGIGAAPSTEKFYVAGSVRFTGSAQVWYGNNTGRCINSSDAGKIIYTSMCKSSAGDRTITPTFLWCIMSWGVAPVQKILLTWASWVDAIEWEACPATQILETSVQ